MAIRHQGIGIALHTLASRAAMGPHDEGARMSEAKRMLNEIWASAGARPGHAHYRSLRAPGRRVWDGNQPG
jgi:hypothetical protein